MTGVKKGVSIRAMEEWKKCIEDRFNAVGESSYLPQAEMSEEDAFSQYETRLAKHAGAIEALNRLVIMARDKPRLVTEAVTMGGSVAEILLTKGDWGGGLAMVSLAPEAFCFQPLRRLGLVSCAQRGFMKGIGRGGGSFTEAGVRAWSDRLTRESWIGPKRFQAFAEECDLIISGRQEWSVDERESGAKLFLGYAAKGEGDWSAETKLELRGLFARAEREVLEWGSELSEGGALGSKPKIKSL